MLEEVLDHGDDEVAVVAPAAPCAMVDVPLRGSVSPPRPASAAGPEADLAPWSITPAMDIAPWAVGPAAAPGSGLGVLGSSSGSSSVGGAGAPGGGAPGAYRRSATAAAAAAAAAAADSPLPRWGGAAPVLIPIAAAAGSPRARAKSRGGPSSSASAAVGTVVAAVGAAVVVAGVVVGWTYHSLLASGFGVVAAYAPAAVACGVAVAVRAPPQADAEYSYGRRRLEPLLGFTVNVSIGLLAAIVAIQALEHLLVSEDHGHLHAFRAAPIAAFTAAAVAVFFVGAAVLRRAAAFWVDGALAEDAPAATATLPSGAAKSPLHVRHSRALLFSALVTALASVLTELGLPAADAAGALSVAATALWDVGPAVLAFGRVLLQGTPPALMYRLSRSLDEVAGLDGVVECRDAHFWTLASDHIVGTVLVRVRSEVRDFQSVRLRVERLFAPMVHDITVEVEQLT
jgi:Co/Zn/Cd efflux system component